MTVLKTHKLRRKRFMRLSLWAAMTALVLAVAVEEFAVVYNLASQWLLGKPAVMPSFPLLDDLSSLAACTAMIPAIWYMWRRTTVTVDDTRRLLRDQL